MAFVPIGVSEVHSGHTGHLVPWELGQHLVTTVLTGPVHWRDQVSAAHCKDRERYSSSDSENPMGGGVRNSQISIEASLFRTKL